MKILPLVFALFALPAFGQWSENGVPIPDEPFRKSNGTFGAMILLSDEPEKFMQDWEKPQPPQIKTTDQAERGKPVVAFILFVGCKEVNHLCNATVDFTVLRPDGSEYASQKGAELWKSKPGPAPNTIQLSVPNLGIVIEPNDPPGRYLVKAVATDVNALRSVSIEQAFTVVR